MPEINWIIDGGKRIPYRGSIMSKASEMQALSTSDELMKSPGAPEVNIPRTKEPEIWWQRLVGVESHCAGYHNEVLVFVFRAFQKLWKS